MGAFLDPLSTLKSDAIYGCSLTDFSGSWVIPVYQEKNSKRWLRITINYFKGLKYIGSIHLRFLIPDRLDLITTIKKECLCARNGKTFGSMSNVCSLQNGLKDFLNSEWFLSNEIALEFVWNSVRILEEFRCDLLLWEKFYWRSWNIRNDLNVDREVLFIEVSLKCYLEDTFSSCKVWQLQRWENFRL